MNRVGAGAASVRVCMLSFYFHPSYSGSATQARNLCRYLTGLGIEAVFISANLTASAACESVDGVVVHRLPLMKRGGLQIPSFAVSLFWFLLRRRRTFDIVHAHGAVPHFAASLFARALGKKSILKIAMVNSDIAFERQGRLWGRINRYLAGRFDCYVATSAEAREECLAQGLDPARLRLIPNGVEADRFRPIVSEEERRQTRARFGLPEGPIVCFVGVIDARKNVDGILRVWREARRQGARGHLLLIGPEAEQGRGTRSAFAEELHHFVAAEGLTGSVTFAGQQSEVPEYLRCSNIFFFPSRREGMPNVVLEAMASGLACVVSAIGGSVDLVQHDKTGYVFGVDDEKGMAGCLVRLLNDPAHVAALGRAARVRVEKEYTLRATAQTYADLYQDLLRG